MPSINSHTPPTHEPEVPIFGQLPPLPSVSAWIANRKQTRESSEGERLPLAFLCKQQRNRWERSLPAIQPSPLSSSPPSSTGGVGGAGERERGSANATAASWQILQALHGRLAAVELAVSKVPWNSKGSVLTPGRGLSCCGLFTAQAWRDPSCLCYLSGWHRARPEKKTPGAIAGTEMPQRSPKMRSGAVQRVANRCLPRGRRL